MSGRSEHSQRLPSSGNVAKVEDTLILEVSQELRKPGGETGVDSGIGFEESEGWKMVRFDIVAIAV